MCAFVQSTKTFKPKEFYLSRIFNGKKNVPFSEKFPKLIVRRIFTTKLNPPEPMEAKIIDPNSFGVILRMVYKGWKSSLSHVTWQNFSLFWPQRTSYLIPIFQTILIKPFLTQKIDPIFGSKIDPIFYPNFYPFLNKSFDPKWPHTSSLSFKQALETILSWKPSKSNPQYYVINIAPTAKSCGRFHKEPIRYVTWFESSHDI